MSQDSRFEMRMSSEMLERIDKARGLLTRAGFVKGAVEDALQRLEASAPAGAPVASVPAFAKPKPQAFRADRPKFMCPDRSCPWVTSDKGEVCPEHRRNIVPFKES